ncbi:MAG: glutathione S-transferase family protein [Pseudomonadota bacterium]
MIKLYGTRTSRAFRCLWALEECGLSYELISVDWQKAETRTPEFLALNPNGHVPVFEQDGLVLLESLAINHHICQVAQTELSPANPTEQTLAIQWTVWAMGELEGPHDAANQLEQDVDETHRSQAMTVLDKHLRRGGNLIADRFTLADLNTASVLMRPKYLPHIRDYRAANAWFQRCASRPALAKALGRAP